ncbi:MAG: glutamate--tRNA ligase [Epsilonproteobacteria bacterium]|nr:glutamate--tRNA ligase [Campylobacterota bacterium]
MSIITRFAPSPTGFLHIGGLRTALFNYLYARHNNGKFILRIEDTDSERSEERFSDLIIKAFRWVDLKFDDGPYFQSQRGEIYSKYIDRLIEEGKAYKCCCSRERLKKLKESQTANGIKPHYDGFCRGTNNEAAENFTIRFKLPKTDENIEFDDLIHGKILINLSEIDDFIIVRSNGIPMYNFACVVDDALMGVTDIIRGDDHLSNTSKQILLCRALGFDIPRYAHVPMILGADKKRFSKRHGAISVNVYKEEGYLPDALLNYLVRLGFSYNDQEIFSMEEMIRYFDIKRLGKSASVFNPSKLLWLNAVYIKNRVPSILAEEVLPFISALLGTTVKIDEKFVEMVKTVQQRAKTLKEMADQMRFYFETPSDYEEKGVKKYCSSIDLLNKIMLLMKDVQWNESELKKIAQNVMDEFQLKMLKIAQPIRIALTGKTVSPGIYEMLLILGKEESLKRMERFIKFLNAKV